MAHTAVVTGASSGIGRETVRQLVDAGVKVIAVARREDRLRELANECGCLFFSADLTNDKAVEDLYAYASGVAPIDMVINVAGGALGLDNVADADIKRWERMYDLNVLSALRVTRIFLPQLRERGGDIVFVTSTAAHGTYPGGGGYVAAKHGERIIAATLRQELVGEPVRIIEIAPGMVKTEEFSLNRLGSNEDAEKVYEGVENPLLAEDIADAIVWAVTRPSHVNIDSLVVRPRAQATQSLVARSNKK